MGLEARDGAFFLDDQKLVLLSGAVHYFRVVPEYWRDRLQRVAAAGLNCVETYVPWNLHEEVRGEFNFEGILDIRQFVTIAQELGLYVIFRPGPYICSEWDLGGLPSWLLSDPEMQLRSAYPPYVQAVENYFAKLLPLVADLQHCRGGPIIAVQVENEYGSFGDDINYKSFLKETMLKFGIKELLFTSDNGMGIMRGEVPGELITANFQEKDHGHLMFEYVKNVKQPGKPLMVMEFWSGWFDHWGRDQKHQIWPAADMEAVLTWILQQGASVNFYMFHGGTNFGFMNGANEDLGATNEGGGEPYAPDCTSYDYDAPVAENGDLTEKYHLIRKLLRQYLPHQIPQKLPDPPLPIESFAYGDVKITHHLTLDDITKLIESVKTDKLLNMEMLDINNGCGQGYGFSLYRKHTSPGKSLVVKGKVKDRAQVLVNGREAGVLDWTSTDQTVKLPGGAETMVKLDILVENCGRVNYCDYKSPLMDTQRKGLTGEVVVDGKSLDNWEIFPLDFKKAMNKSISEGATWRQGKPSEPGPVLCKGTLHVANKPKDTFLTMPGWCKGIVFVNGFNLGRYWEVGPQQTLYLPAPLLHQGENEFWIFELHSCASTFSLDARPRLGETEVHKVVLPGAMKALLTVLKGVLKMGRWPWFFLKHVYK